MSSGKKRNKKKRSEGEDENCEPKRLDLRKSPGGTESISELLNKANSVLCDEGINVSTSNVFEILSDQSDSDQGQSVNASNKTMESSNGQQSRGPTNSDIMAILSKMNNKLNQMDERLNTLESLDKRVDGFDKELRKLWLFIESSSKATNEKVDKVETRVSSTEVDLEGARSKIADLEIENIRMKEEVNYMKSQSMRNNLIFGNIDEVPSEKPAKTEEIIRNFMIEKLKIARDIVNNIKIERAHRMGIATSMINGESRDEMKKSRRIVCKFSFFGDREMVRGQSKNVWGTRYYVSEQFPPDIMAKRRELVKRMKEEKKAGNQAWVSYDTLYVNGKPVKTHRRYRMDLNYAFGTVMA